MSKKIFLILISVFILNVTQIPSYAQKNITKTEKQIGKKHELVGKATWYGSHYSSTRKTASGERFDKNLFTAAHKTLPFGTKVKVICEKTNKSVIVKINDRGPFGKGRVIDLSVAAAKELGIIRCGTAPVTLEILD